MPAANDLRAILDAAEQAAARKDMPAAERLLRDALALQETTPGAPRDEIAKTLNNLAVVCEMTGKLTDAETCYRRAFTIATASLPAADPFVSTSRENLEAFCRAQGLPLAPPPARAPQPAAARPAAPPPAPAAPRSPSPAPPSFPRAASAVDAETPPGRSRASKSSRAIIVGVLFFLSAIAVGIVIARNWFAPSVAQRAETISQSDPQASGPAPASVPEPAAAPSPIEAKPEPPATTASSPAPTVVSAQLCRSLVTSGTWQCESASGTQAPGLMYFYTRVASPRDTVVEHRWYRDDRIHQRVELNIRANPGGFRTYSRTTISLERAGAWKVELRSEDGRVLHEETFTVQ